MSSTDQKLNYRPDIDGLRAVAVLAVMGFHAFPRRFPGGFVGVDVFFVISGYLISSVILQDLSHERFRFRVFYARRVRRIFPALVTVLVACLAVAWFMFLGPEFRSLGRRIAGGAAFASNFQLLDSRGYFAPQSDSEPLLHLWSLAIEEQFYIVWPLLFYLAWKTRTNLGATVALITVVSFSMNLWTNLHSGEAFFLPWTRAWELGAGALLATPQAPITEKLHPFVKGCIATAGLLSIGAAIFFVNSEETYPGVRTLAPVLGAALLIAMGSDTAISRRVLSTPLLVGCGLISYPLYLWHWPLLSLGDIVVNGWLNPQRRILILLASFVLAFLTYLWIEKPMRFGRRGPLKAVALLVLMFATGCFGLITQYGYVPTLSQIRGVDRNLTDKFFAASSDWDFPGEGSETVPGDGTNFIRYRGSRDQRVIWFLGDSEMQQFGPRIRKLIAAHPQEYSSAVFTTRGGCLPLPDLAWAKYRSLCNGFFDRAMEFGKDKQISTVVIGAAWPYAVDGVIHFYSERIDQNAGLPIEDVVYRQLEDLLRDLHSQGKTTYLLLPIPTGADLDPGRMISRHLSFHPFGVNFTVPVDPGIPIDSGPVPAIRAHLKTIAARTAARVIDPYDYVCQNNFCNALDEKGEPIYKDDSHLRATFVREHASFIDRVLSDE